MKQKLSYWTGIISVLLFVFTTIIAGFNYSNYNSISQFISELYAVNAPNADIIRYYFYLPSGILFLLFAFFSNASLPKSKLKTTGLILIGFGYGFGTILCSIFNCDMECNPKFINPSISQIIHNLMGMITYFIVPIGILLIAIASKKWDKATIFTGFSYSIAFLSFIFVILLNANITSPLKGLFQRIIEASILIWIVVCSIYINKNLINNS